MNFLVQSGEIEDTFEAGVFLAQHIAGMVDEGHSNKILMANRAISAYRASLPEPDGQASEIAHAQSMEELLGSSIAGRRTEL